MYIADVRVMLKETVLDPQALSLKTAIDNLGFGSVKSVYTGKHFRIELEAESADKAHEITKGICERLLANPVLENFEISIVPLGGGAK